MHAGQPTSAPPPQIHDRHRRIYTPRCNRCRARTGRGSPPAALTLGLAQIKTKLGDVAANLDKHLDYVEQAAAQGVDLLCFPELSLTGYQVQDLAARSPSAPRPTIPSSRRCSTPATTSTCCSASSTRTTPALLHRQRLSLRRRDRPHPSQNLPADLRHVRRGPLLRPGRAACAPSTRASGASGMLICEDFWHMSPAYLLWLDGADMLHLPSVPAPAGDLDAATGSSRHALGRAGQSGLWQHVHQLRDPLQPRRLRGRQEFLGRLVGRRSRTANFCCTAPTSTKRCSSQTIDLNQLHRTRSRLPLLRDERPRWCSANSPAF